jgi:hypothetical protein
MIEVLLLNYLNNAGLSATVYTEQPKEKPSKFFLIEKTGGIVTEHITESTFAIQSLADSMFEAASMSEEVKTAMSNAIILPEISRVEINSDYNFTDTSTKKYRYQAVFVVTHY